jgi:hypothetical protein
LGSTLGLKLESPLTPNSLGARLSQACTGTDRLRRSAHRTLTLIPPPTARKPYAITRCVTLSTVRSCLLQPSDAKWQKLAFRTGSSNSYRGTPGALLFPRADKEYRVMYCRDPLIYLFLIIPYSFFHFPFSSSRAHPPRASNATCPSCSCPRLCIVPVSLAR